MFKMKKLPQGEELEKLAVQLGVSFHNLSDPDTGIDESELQRRVINAINVIRGGNLWVLAVLSAIAAIVSACASWYAVLFRVGC